MAPRCHIDFVWDRSSTQCQQKQRKSFSWWITTNQFTVTHTVVECGALRLKSLNSQSMMKVKCRVFEVKCFKNEQKLLLIEPHRFLPLESSFFAICMQLKISILIIAHEIKKVRPFFPEINWFKNNSDGNPYDVLVYRVFTNTVQSVHLSCNSLDRLQKEE